MLDVCGNGRTIAEVVDGDNLAENEANAHLIAAAPEMYAALRRLLDDEALGKTAVRACVQARAAIAKAEGRHA